MDNKTIRLQAVAIAALFLTVTGLISLVSRLWALMKGGKDLFVILSYFLQSSGIWLLLLLVMVSVLLLLIRKACGNAGLLSIFLDPLVLLASGILIAAEAILTIGSLISAVMINIHNLKNMLSVDNYVYKAVSSNIPSFILMLVQLAAGFYLLHMYKSGGNGNKAPMQQTKGG